jgi:hypothetical protein
MLFQQTWTLLSSLAFPRPLQFTAASPTSRPSEHDFLLSNPFLTKILNSGPPLKFYPLFKLPFPNTAQRK